MAVKGFVLYRKQAGLTSFQSLGVIKKIYNTKKVGHTGTLDKFASGVMVVCLGSYTRFASFITDQDKTYRAVIQFGTQTDTLDPEGAVTATGHIPVYADVLETLPSFEGQQEQFPPKYSAVHIHGKRAYERIRDGETFQMPSRDITIHEIQPLAYQNGQLTVRIRCSKGTYIRSLARDIAASLGTVGYVAELEREKVGNVQIDRCNSAEEVGIDPLACLHDSSEIVTQLFDIPTIELVPSRLQDFSHGGTILPYWFKNGSEAMADGTYVVIGPDECIAGIVQKRSECYSYKCVLL